MQSSCWGLHFVVAPRLCTTKNDQNSQMQLWGCHITWIIVNVGESSSHATPYSWLDVCFKPLSIKLTNSRSSCPMDILPKIII